MPPRILSIEPFDLHNGVEEKTLKITGSMAEIIESILDEIKSDDLERRFADSPNEMFSRLQTHPEQSEMLFEKALAVAAWNIAFMQLINDAKREGDKNAKHKN